MRVACVVALLACVRVVVGDAGVFLAKTDLLADLMSDLDSATGRDKGNTIETRAVRLEDAMRGMFDVLPKNELGQLDGASVRYMLRRLFVERHGWFVQGLESQGQAWNSSAPTALISHHVDAEKVFTDHVAGKGFTLHQAAVLAATFESFVHDEAVLRLQAAFRLVGIHDSEVELSPKKVELAMRAYMILYVNGLDPARATRSLLKRFLGAAKSVLPIWHDIKNFLAATRASVLENDDEARAAPSSRQTVVKVVERVAEQFGKWQDGDCRDVKQKLTALETLGSGRVPLAKFYTGGFHFIESVTYLRELGSLDESDPANMRVIIPNYLNGLNNCMHTTKYYNVCCIDECNGLFTHLERHIAAPSARPAQILELVQGLASDTVPAPRQLDEALVQKLSEIAAHHGGEIPLHGRLFAQWMHYAYPRECNFPHISGTTKPESQDAFMGSRGRAAMIASAAEIKEIKEAAIQREGALVHEEFGMWSLHEELVANHHRVVGWVAIGKPVLLICSALLSVLAMARQMFTVADGLVSDLNGKDKGKQLFV